jgi:RimJ/RimL family protein N-acetyltransferase
MTAYAIRVEGHLDDHWSAWLGALDLARDADGATTIEVADQAQLHGVLAGLRDIGAVISELHARPAPARPLRTARLTLRPATAADAEAVSTLEAWRTADRERLADTVVVTLGHHAAAPIAGVCTLRAHGDRAELGWAFDPAHAGCAAEAVRELLRHCFADLGVRRVTASCFLADEAAWRLMERAGMRRERHAVRAARHRSGRWLDTVGYAILADEWSGRRG